jgi:hypothetical protein
LMPLNAQEVLSPQFTVPKKNTDKRRPIIDLRALNNSIPYPSFKMERVKDLPSIVRQNSWFVKMDLQDAYSMVPMSPTSMRKLGVRGLGQHKGRKLYYRGMPFGLNVAPRAFTRIMKPVVAHFRRMGISLLIYLDDILICAQTQEETLKHAEVVATTIQRLGLLINWEKSVLNPARRMEFLGFIVDSTTMSLEIPEEKIHAIQLTTSQMIASKRTTVRRLASILGTINAVGPACLPAFLKTRRLLDLKNAARRKHQKWGAHIHLSPEAIQELKWWRSNIHNHKSRALPAPPTLKIVADASNSGWGAALIDLESQKELLHAHGHWSSKEQALHINTKEVLAQELALHSFKSEVQGRSLLLESDNTTAVAYIRKQGGCRSREATIAAERMWTFLLANEVAITIRHIPGVTNDTADALSRQATDRNDWKLHPEVFQDLEKRWGRHTIDLFATRLNAQLPKFYSWGPDPLSAGRDALQQNWTGENAYANPPWPLIQAVLEKFENTDHMQLTLITPLWESAVWFPRLKRLAKHCQPLPQQSDLFSPASQANKRGIGPAKWRAAAWRLFKTS